jgi:DNA (cytosine-5)-methyltransferase 1
LTVTLSNYDIDKNEKTISKWVTSVQYGNGEGFPIYFYPNGYYKKIEPIIKELHKGKKFLYIINNGFSEKIGSKRELQEMYESQRSIGSLLEPSELIEEVARLIEKLEVGKQEFVQNGRTIFKNKETVPIKQLFALYAINKIASTA